MKLIDARTIRPIAKDRLRPDTLAIDPILRTPAPVLR
jgi:hypothetical protein